VGLCPPILAPEQQVRWWVVTIDRHRRSKRTVEKIGEQSPHQKKKSNDLGRKTYRGGGVGTRKGRGGGDSKPPSKLPPRRTRGRNCCCKSIHGSRYWGGNRTCKQLVETWTGGKEAGPGEGLNLTEFQLAENEPTLMTKPFHMKK